MHELQDSHSNDKQISGLFSTINPINPMTYFIIVYGLLTRI